MTKSKKVYVCQSCGFDSAQWLGQCPGCNNWNTFSEEVILKPRGKSSQKGSGAVKSGTKPVKLSSVNATTFSRSSSGIKEFDRVLGGGFVPGQVVLLSGEPGIGKSTLLTEIPKNMTNGDILYVCGEESIEQIKLRAQRLGVNTNNLYMLPENDANVIVATIEASKKFSLVIVDSIQTVTSEEFAGISGSISQVRGCAGFLTSAAKRLNIPIILVGHVTKQGVVAGPKVLEHIVDTVLQLEGDSQHLFRVLRTTKNRFGPLSEVGIFEMTGKGLVEVKNPSELFLEQKLDKAPGSTVTVVMEGQRPLLFEIQALTVSTSFGYPRRTTSGFNVNRLQVLVATLEKRAKIRLSNHDIYVNIAGGFSVKEYAADLSVCLSIASALKNKPLKKGTVAFGEVGLNGEIRRVPHQDRRVKEAQKLGYSNIITPENSKTIIQALNKSLPSK